MLIVGDNEWRDVTILRCVQFISDLVMVLGVLDDMVKVPSGVV